MDQEPCSCTDDSIWMLWEIWLQFLRCFLGLHGLHSWTGFAMHAAKPRGEGVWAAYLKRRRFTVVFTRLELSRDHCKTACTTCSNMMQNTWHLTAEVGFFCMIQEVWAYSGTLAIAIKRGLL